MKVRFEPKTAVITMHDDLQYRAWVRWKVETTSFFVFRFFVFQNHKMPNIFAEKWTK